MPGANVWYATLRLRNSDCLHPEQNFQDGLLDGGNVTTVHNARKGVYANDEDRTRYERDYDPGAYHLGNDAYLDKKDELGRGAHAGDLKDVYNNRRDLGPGDYDTEHVVSAKEIHDRPEARLFMDEQRSSDLANRDENMGATARGLNRSKKEDKLWDWADQPCTADPSKTNADYYGVDREDAAIADERARDMIEKELSSAELRFYTREAVRTGVAEGARMGLQQAIGLVLYEFADALFDEARDVYRDGWKGGAPDRRFFAILRERLMRVASRVASKWQNVVAAFAEGALAGFLSNLVTMIVNMFITTGRRIVRIIRDGVFAILRAIKILICPPEGMTRRIAAHEASKLIGGGLAIAGGVLLEEGFEQVIVAALPMLAPIAPVFSSVTAGVVTGLATVLLAYAIDRIDLLGVKEDERHTYIVRRLDDELEALFSEGDELIDAMGLEVPP